MGEGCLELCCSHNLAPNELRQIWCASHSRRLSCSSLDVPGLAFVDVVSSADCFFVYSRSARWCSTSTPARRSFIRSAIGCTVRVCGPDAWIVGAVVAELSLLDEAAGISPPSALKVHAMPMLFRFVSSLFGFSQKRVPSPGSNC